MWFDGVAEVIHVDESEGTLEVKITRQGKYTHVEPWWDLESTIEAFERGEYTIVESKAERA